MLKKIPKPVKDLLRMLIGFGVAAFLIRMVVTQNNVAIGDELKNSLLHWIVLGFVVYGFALCIGAARWRSLLQVQGVQISLWMAIRLTMIGVFFSLVIPGAVGGDVVKMVYIAKHSDENKAEAVMTIFLDRIFGLLGLCVVAAVAIATSMELIMRAEWELQVIIISVGCISAGGIVGVFVAAFHNQIMALPGIRHLVHWGAGILPDKITHMVGRLVKAIDLYRHHRMVLVQTLLLSVVVHTCITVVVYCISSGFHVSDVSPRHYFLATQAANTVGAVPPTPGGFGARDMALSGFLKLAGAAETKAGIIAPALTMTIILWSLCGGIFYFFAPIKRDALDEVDTEEMMHDAEEHLHDPDELAEPQA